MTGVGGATLSILLAVATGRRGTTRRERGRGVWAGEIFYLKFLEPQVGAILEQIMTLVLNILFIQKRHAGLLRAKRRVID